MTNKISIHVLIKGYNPQWKRITTASTHYNTDFIENMIAHEKAYAAQHGLTSPFADQNDEIYIKMAPIGRNKSRFFLHNGREITIYDTFGTTGIAIVEKKRYSNETRTGWSYHLIQYTTDSNMLN